MTYSFLSEQENNFIQKTELLVANIKREFAQEIKYIVVCNYDFVQINISRSFLDSVLDILKRNKDQHFVGWSNFFFHQEYFMHLNYILLIIARLLDNHSNNPNSLLEVEGKILKPKSKFSVKTLIEFLDKKNNMDKIESLNNKIIQFGQKKQVSSGCYTIQDPFPNYLYFKNIKEWYKELEGDKSEDIKSEDIKSKTTKVTDIYKELKLEDFRNKYLVHNDKNTSLFNLNYNIYLNTDFVILLKEIENLLNIFYSILDNKTMEHGVTHPGYSVKDIFAKLEVFILEEVKNIKLGKFGENSINE